MSQMRIADTESSAGVRSFAALRTTKFTGTLVFDGDH